MTEVTYSSVLAGSLQGRVVVMTGGVSDIGAATVAMLYKQGAHVYFGDLDATKGALWVEELQKTASKGRGSVHFQQLDVRDYQAQVQLFETPFSRYGRVDVAISCVSATEPHGWFTPENLDLETVRTEPGQVYTAIEVNLTSVISFTRIALAYLKGSPEPPKGHLPFSKSIVLVSSVAGITDSPSLPTYTSTKHGVIGLMRGLRGWSSSKYGVRINTVCPCDTETQMVSYGVHSGWANDKLPVGLTVDASRMIVQCAADTDLNGKAIVVGSGGGFDVEDGITKTLPQWMGPVLAAEVLRDQQVLALGDK